MYRMQVRIICAGRIMAVVANPISRTAQRGKAPRRHFHQRAGTAILFPKLRRCAHGPPLLETFAAEHGPALRRAERNCRFLPALRAGRFGFRPLEAISPWTRALRAFGFAVLAPLGLVLEALIGEKHLFAGGEDKLLTAFRALQDLSLIHI